MQSQLRVLQPLHPRNNRFSVDAWGKPRYLTPIRAGLTGPRFTAHPRHRDGNARGLSSGIVLHIGEILAEEGALHPLGRRHHVMSEDMQHLLECQT